jgi:hypothetical protein
VGGNDGRIDDKFEEERGITRKPFIAELPPMPPKRNDFMSIERLPDPRVTGPNVGGPVESERYPISVGVPGTDMFKQFPAPGQTPTIIDEIPRPKPGIIKQVNSVTRTPLRKKMIPPLQKPMSIGGIGGMSGRRSTQPMLRADGGGVNKALEELRNRLR